MEREGAPALRVRRRRGRRHDAWALLLQERGEAAKVGRSERDVRALVAKRSLERAEEAGEVVNVLVVEELGADAEERAVDLEVLPVVALAERRHEVRRLAGGERDAERVRGKEAGRGVGWGERLGHACNLEIGAYTRCVESGIREVEDNVEATEAWNGPLFEVWIKYRELTAEGLRQHGENAIRLRPPAEGDRVLDIGCGLGDTTARLAELVGRGGQRAWGRRRRAHDRDSDR